MMLEKGVSAGKEMAMSAARAHARRHWGVITRAELAACGVTRSAIETLVRRGEIRRVHQSVYVVGGAPPAWEQRALAAVRASGRGAALSGESAGALLGLRPCRKGRIEIISPASRRLSDANLRKAWIPGDHIRVVRGIPVTHIERTLLDLCARGSAFRSEEALDSALHQRLTALPRIHHFLSEMQTPGRRGVRWLRELLAVRDPSLAPHESVLETRLARLIREAGLPRPIPQLEVARKSGFVARLDFAYPHLGIAVEADGYEWHSGVARWKRDLRRHNELTNLGWRLLHFTWHDVTWERRLVIEQISHALAQPQLFSV